jgi:hypothetical protein
MPGMVARFGYRREIRAGQECQARGPGKGARLQENRDSDHVSRPLTLGLKGKHIVDPARSQADPRDSNLLNVINVTSNKGVFAHLLRHRYYRRSCRSTTKEQIEKQSSGAPSPSLERMSTLDRTLT